MVSLGVRLPADKRVLLRWTFRILGYALLFAPNYVIHSVLLTDAWAELLYPDDAHMHRRLVAAAYLLILPVSLLCLATSRGLYRSRPWARWCGILTSLLLLPGFPWLTLIGIVCLFVLLVRAPALGKTAVPAGSPAAAPLSKDYWSRKRRSPALSIVTTILLIVTFGLVGAMTRRAQHTSIREHSELVWWTCFLASFLLQTAIHEFGHASVAWALGSRVKVISIGPFTFGKDRYGSQFHFDWKRLLDSGGYMGAVPTATANLRLTQIAVIAAGPAASLLNGLVLLAVYFWAASLPGQSSYWNLVQFNAALGLYYGIGNLVPLGVSDGSMLFHLLLNTRPGRQLLDGVVMLRIQEDADACHNQADFEKEVELRQSALQQASQTPDGNQTAVAMCHQRVGHANLAAHNWPAAEAALRRCLSFEAECAALPPLAANAWSGLQKACVDRHNVVEAQRAYNSAVQLIESRKKDRERVGLSVTHIMLAQVHARANQFELAHEEAHKGLRILPQGPERLLLRSSLHSIQARCELAQGFVDAGLASAQQAAKILRSDQVPPVRRNLAWDDLGDLADGLWQNGETETAIEFIREAADRLQSAGAFAVAARWRIRLVRLFRELGRLNEASAGLPADSALPPATLRLLLEERIRLLLAAGRPQDALADAQDLLHQWSVEPGADIETAVAKSLLAEACLDAGGLEQAHVLARKAAEVLGPISHPEAARCLITIALARWRSAREWTPDRIVEARRLIETDPLLTPTAKTRALAAEAARLARFGRAYDAEALRTLAPPDSTVITLTSPQTAPALV